MTTTTTTPSVRLISLLAATIAVVALGVGIALGLLAHSDGYVTTQGDAFTGKVVGVKDDSICIAQGSKANCALPLYAQGVHPAVGDKVKVVELEAKDDTGATTSVYYVLKRV